jgi:hypothetical protein
MNSDLLLPNSSSLPTPQWYGPLDPYFYTVDNRPLQDIDTNMRSMVGGSVAALYRAVGINDQVLTPLAMGAIKAPGSTGTYSGLQLGNPGVGSVTVGVGALFFTDSINTTNGTLITKMAASPATKTLATPAPSTAGQFISYLIEGTVSYLDASSMPASSVPFVDSTNTLLPGLIANAELKLSVKAGSSSTTPATPSTTAGSYPLYVITVGQDSTVKVSSPVSAPVLASAIRIRPEVTLPASGAAGTSVMVGSAVPEFADGAVTSANIQVTLDPTKIDTTKPLRLTLSLASTAANNNVVFGASYKVVGAGFVTSGSSVSTTNDTVTIGAASTVQEFTTVNASIPTSAFAGWVGTAGSQVWAMTKSRVYLQLTRVGTDSGDTHTGAVSLVDVAVTQ